MGGGGGEGRGVMAGRGMGKLRGKRQIILQEVLGMKNEWNVDIRIKAKKAWS